MEQRDGSVIRNLAHQLLSQQECKLLKVSLKHFRNSKSVTTLVTELKKFINTTEKILLLAEISYMMPRRLQEDYNKLCALHFDGYRHVLRSCDPTYRCESPLKVIAQNTSGSAQVVSSPSQKKLLIKDSKHLRNHVMPDIRLSEYENQTSKPCKSLEDDRNQSMKHVEQELMTNQMQGGSKVTNPDEDEIRSSNYKEDIKDKGRSKGGSNHGKVEQERKPRLMHRGSDDKMKVQRVIRHIVGSNDTGDNEVGHSRQRSENGKHRQATIEGSHIHRQATLERLNNRKDAHTHTVEGTDKGINKVQRSESGKSRKPDQNHPAVYREQPDSTSNSGESNSSGGNNIPVGGINQEMHTEHHPTNSLGTEMRRRRHVRKVELAREEGISLGFCIRGDAKTGIFVSDVDDGGQADVKDLRVGDRILKVNDTSLRDLSHIQAAEVIRGATNLLLYVTAIHGHKMPAGKAAAVSDGGSPDEKHVTLKADPDGWLGCSIRGGTDYGIDVVISNVDPMSPAQRVGIRKGDVILQMNGTDVRGMTHMQVVTLATSTQELQLVLKPTASKTRRTASLANLGDRQSQQTSTPQQRQRQPVARHNSSPGRTRRDLPPTPPSSPLRWQRAEDLRRFEEELQRTPPVESSTPLPPPVGQLQVFSDVSAGSQSLSPTVEFEEGFSEIDNNAAYDFVKQIKEDEKLAKILSGTIRNNMLHGNIDEDLQKFTDAKAKNSPNREHVRNIFNAQSHSSPHGAKGSNTLATTSAKRNLVNNFQNVQDIYHTPKSNRGDIVLHLERTPDSENRPMRPRSVSPRDRQGRDPRVRSRSQPRIPSPSEWIKGGPISPQGSSVFFARSPKHHIHGSPHRAVLSPKRQIYVPTPTSPGMSPYSSHYDRAFAAAMSRAADKRNRALELAVYGDYNNPSDDEWML